MKYIITYLEGNTELDLKIKENKAGIEAINQTVRNGIKASLKTALANDLTDLLGDEAIVGETREGVAIQVEIGGEKVSITLDPVIKTLDYDIHGEIKEHADTMAEKEAERIAKENKKK